MLLERRRCDFQHRSGRTIRQAGDGDTASEWGHGQRSSSGGSRGPSTSQSTRSSLPEEVRKTSLIFGREDGRRGRCWRAPVLVVEITSKHDPGSDRRRALIGGSLKDFDRVLAGSPLHGLDSRQTSEDRNSISRRSSAVSQLLHLCLNLSQRRESSEMPRRCSWSWGDVWRDLVQLGWAKGGFGKVLASHSWHKVWRREGLVQG